MSQIPQIGAPQDAGEDTRAPGGEDAELGLGAPRGGDGRGARERLTPGDSGVEPGGVADGHLAELRLGHARR
jgi:hypothetical protein